MKTTKWEREEARRKELERLQEKKTRTLRPKIVCWHKEWEWIVGIKVPEKFASQMLFKMVNL
jgi:hypothetical protein